MTIAALAASGTSTQTANVNSRAQLSENFDTFLKLLTAQLANQDPLDPLDSNKFTEQLVAYSQVEQQIKTNEQLENLIGQTRASTGAAAVSYLGKLAVIDSNRTTLTADGAAWNYSFDKAAANVRLTVRDSAGRDVFSATGEKGTGPFAFKWDGRDSRGAAAPEGAYTLVVQAVDANGGVLTSKIATEERIIGVGFDANGVTLRTGSGEKPFATVRSIRD
jgi:flagellar basal-body rod modification protein FlgD